MKINIEKSQIWTPLWTPFAPPFLYYWSDLTKIFTQYVKSKKETLFVRENFFHLGLSFSYIAIQIYINIYIYI